MVLKFWAALLVAVGIGQGEPQQAPIRMMQPNEVLAQSSSKELIPKQGGELFSFSDGEVAGLKGLNAARHQEELLSKAI